MNLKFALDELATEGPHAARITAVKELGMVKGQFRSEEKIRITFEMLDQQDANGDYATVGMMYAAKATRGSYLGKLLDDMGWRRNGKGFDLRWLVGETMHVNIQHNRDGKFANVVSVIKDQSVIREYRRPCPWTGCKEFVNPHTDEEVKTGRCYRHCYLKPVEALSTEPTEPTPEEWVCCKDGDCTNQAEPGSNFCYRHGGEL